MFVSLFLLAVHFLILCISATEPGVSVMARLQDAQNGSQQQDFGKPNVAQVKAWVEAGQDPARLLVEMCGRST